MRSVFYILDVAPYGSEKAYGMVNAAAVCTKMDVTLELYAYSVYLVLVDQDSKALCVPNLSDIIYAYPEIRILAHEPSLAERGLMNQSLIERVELADENEFIEHIQAADCVIML